MKYMGYRTKPVRLPVFASHTVIASRLKEASNWFAEPNNGHRAARVPVNVKSIATAIVARVPA